MAREWLHWSNVKKLWQKVKLQLNSLGKLLDWIMNKSGVNKRFSDFASDESLMDGSKVKIVDVLNKEIEVIAFKICDSKHKIGEKCLKLQFLLDGEKYIIFTGSGVLIEQCNKYRSQMPFIAIIKNVNKYYTFS